jgi:hypothetical protein
MIAPHVWIHYMELISNQGYRDTLGSGPDFQRKKNVHAIFSLQNYIPPHCPEKIAYTRQHTPTTVGLYMNDPIDPHLIVGP